MKTGIDVAKLERFEKLVENQAFLERVFTQKEIKHIFQHSTIAGKIERLAGKFCAKEAVCKALGCGIADGVNFRDIEILSDEKGCPKVMLYNGAKEMMEFLKLNQIEVSISHDGDIAVANCVAI